MSNVFVPIFEQDDNKFFIIHNDFQAETELDALKIGYGSMLVECVLMGMQFNSEVREIDTRSILYQPANLGGCSVAILSGTLFDEDD